MASTPQETMISKETQPIPRPLSGDEVVISGISGIFPKSNSALEFMNNLFNKVDMVTDQKRWIFNHPEVPQHLGQIDGMGKFDAQFFKVHYKQAMTMDPMSRKLLEHAYSAIFDSGVNPLQLRGKKVGVFIGSTLSEFEKVVIYENIQRNGFGISGCNRSMYANRISYWIDGKGPSYSLDAGCASSLVCLEHAYRSISMGQCEAAIVGGSNLCMHPNVSLNMKRAGFLCLDGKTKCFDKSGDGFVRSDAISVIFLQKAKDAKRIYSEVYHAKCNYSKSMKDEFLPIREPQEIQEFLESFYSEINVSPEDVEYVEGNACGIAEADANELQAVSKVFAKKAPIKIGSVKSNMGHSEPASGVCALTKVCLAYHKGKLPANLHYHEPQNGTATVRDQNVKVLTEHVPFKRGFTGINSFSFSGANVHVLLKGHYKAKDFQRYKTSIPYLVLACGREDSCVLNIINSINIQSIDPEQIGLLHKIHASDIPGHTCRGYTIVETNSLDKTVCVAKQIQFTSGFPLPIWFVYSGMGSQWAGMGADLMRIPIFAAAIEKCHRILEPKGIDIVKILTDPDKTIYDNILHSFVGIAAVQLGLTDILKEMGIVPDNIIGHSVGELGCAYADGCFTAEEMILAAYSRGLVSVQTPLIKGSMAAVGLGYKTIQPLCPPEIEVACHNSAESSTISGPADVMQTFVQELTSRGIFAKEVPCSNIAYHSRYIADAGTSLLQCLSEVIKDPQPRSSKWLSTSVPQDQWGEPKALYSSAEYHTNNLLSPVLFEETAKHIPENALVIEIAPHGLLQAILKRSLSKCVHIPLTRRGHANPVNFFLEAIGQLYVAGLVPQVDVLYPKIQFPVSTETPLLSHLVEWQHNEDWPQALYNSKIWRVSAARDFVTSVHDDDQKYLLGYSRDGSYVFSEAALLVLVWETFAMFKGLNYRNMSVTIEDIKFLDEIIINTEIPLRLDIMIHKGYNNFEVSYEKNLIFTGIIREFKKNYELPIEHNIEKEATILLDTKDVYKILANRGYSYEEGAKAILSTNSSQSIANIHWNDDWIPFLDALMQLNSLARPHDGVSIPRLIGSLCIDTEEHKITKQVMSDSTAYYKAHISNDYAASRCGGVCMKGVVFMDKPIANEPSELTAREFIPHCFEGNIDLRTALHVCLQTVAENSTSWKIQVADLISTAFPNIRKVLTDVAEEILTNEFVINMLKDVNDTNSTHMSNIKCLSEPNLIVTNDLLHDQQRLNSLHTKLSESTFILSIESDNPAIKNQYKGYVLVATLMVQKQVFVLIKKCKDMTNVMVTYMTITEDNKYSWVPKCRTELERSGKLILVSEKQKTPHSGVLGLVQSLKNEYGNKISLLMICDHDSPPFNHENKISKEQLQKNLLINVYKKGKWGGYYYIPCAKTANLKNITLTVTTVGDLDSLTWLEAQTSASTTNLVQVCYAGISAKDAQNATGSSKHSKSFGMDFSGFNARGENVMGVIPTGAISSTVEADPHLLWPVPEHWSLVEAATVPLPYLQAYYCLRIRCNLVSGYSVFVSDGAGAFGQAVISICLATGCSVFTTVSNVKNKQFLLRRFPDLDENNVGDSSDESFHSMVINNTKNRRCEIVINCLSGFYRQNALKCVGVTGIFLDISDTNMRANWYFGMNYLIDERNYVGVKFSTIFKPEYAVDKKTLQLAIAEGIANGVVTPLSHVVYPPTDVVKAFRLLSCSRHSGRVLLRMGDHATMKQEISVLPRMTYSANDSYVVICNENELGIELVDRIVRQGGRKIIIHMKPTYHSGYFQTKIESWKEQNATVKISSNILTTEEGCIKLFKEGMKLGAIQGVFVVQNIDELGTLESFESCDVTAKLNESTIQLTNIDLASRKICNELRHFVVLSHSSESLSDEYAASVADDVCQARNEIGLPGLVLRTASIKGFNTYLDVGQRKVQPQSISAAFHALESSIKLGYNNVMAYNLKKKTKSDLLTKFGQILGVNSLDGISESTTIDDFNLNNINLDEIKFTIKSEVGQIYTMDKIRKLTIASLKHIAKNVPRTYTNFDSGLGAFYSFIDQDECMATEPLVIMPTQLSKATQHEEQLDPKATYLWLIPGFEGYYRLLVPVCERLKINAMTLQLGPDFMENSIRGMALKLFKFIKNRFELKSKFYLLGYSFGVNVALELANLFESEGHVGIVYCLDSSPDALRVHLDAYVGELTETKLQNTIVEHMYSLMSGKNSDTLTQELEKIEHWADKMETCVKKLRGLVTYSTQYKKSIMETAYKRIKMSKEYEPNFVLESELVLIKGIPHPKAKLLPGDYNLSKYTKHPVHVFNIESDHALAPYDCRVSNIVNKFLEPKLLEEFQSMNLCEQYLANPYKAW